MLPQIIYLSALLTAANALNGAHYSRPSSRIDDGETPAPWIEEKLELLNACQTCDTARAIRVLALAQEASLFSAAEQEQLIKTTIGACGETRSGIDILEGFASSPLASRGTQSFNFNYFTRGLPPIFLASVSAARSCNLDLVRVMLNAGASPNVPFTVHGLTTDTYATLEELAKNNSCGPCTRDVFRLFPRQDEFPNLDPSSMPQEPEQQPMPSESMQIIMQMQADSGSQQDQGAGDQGGSSSGGGWGAFFSDFWKNL